MKYLKISLVAFIATFVFAGVGVNAKNAFYGYAGISLPAFKGTVSKGPHTKTETGLQYYENTGTINSVTGNENGIQVRVISEGNTEEPIKSDWLVLAQAGQSGSWAKNSKTTVKRAYNIEMKNNTTSIYSASHSGTWYLDKSAYDLTH